MRRLDGQLDRMGRDFRTTRGHLARAIDALESATRWLVETYPQNPNAAAAVAVPYLKLFGTVAGGWLMARAAVIARAKLEEPQSDRDFLSAKIATARFYAEHILPQARALADAVLTGSASVLALDEAQF